MFVAGSPARRLLPVDQSTYRLHGSCPGGYLARVVRASLRGESEPPVFEDWEDLLVDGFRAWLISVVYLIVSLVVAVVTAGGAMLAFLTGSDAGVAVGVAGLFGGHALSAVLSLVFGYVAVVGGVLGIIPVVGAVLTAVVTFYASVVAADNWGKGFAAAHGDRTEPPVDERGDVAV